MYQSVHHLRGELLEHAVLADAVLAAERAPELAPDLVPALPYLQADDLTGHLGASERCANVVGFPE